MGGNGLKGKGMPVALILAGAALGAYIVVRRRRLISAIESVPKLDNVLNACNDSLNALEQRITKFAS